MYNIEPIDPRLGRVLGEKKAASIAMKVWGAITLLVSTKGRNTTPSDLILNTTDANVENMLILGTASMRLRRNR